MRAAGRRSITLVLLSLVLVGATPVAASVTETVPDGVAKEVSLYVPRWKNRRNVFQFTYFPEKGVAVVNTYAGDGGVSGRDVAYAIAVPPVAFDGSLDLKFPGLGEVVGKVTPDSPPEPAAQAKLCESESPGESAEFEGHLVFRGAGGYAHWETSRADAGIVLGCGTEPKREDGPAALFHHVSDFGPVLIGPAPIRLFAGGEARHRYLECIAWGGHSSNFVEFNAIDREWLPGEIATERWVKKSPASLKKTLALETETAEPAGAVLTPPAPFFGKGTYQRRTGKLTGSIGVNFLGLKLHLTPSPLPATLVDEGPR